MSAEVNDGSDRLRNENDPIGESPVLQRRDPASERGGYNGTGQLVVGHRRMADVSREKNFFFVFAGNDQLAVRERAGSERRIDDGMVSPRRELITLCLLKAESPAAIIVRSDVRNCVGL